MLEKYRKILEKFKDLDAKVIVFGSVARGDSRIDSDIDIAIVTDKKEVKEIAESLADDILFKFNKVVSITYFSEKEFEKEKDPLIKVIKKEGVVINDGKGS